MPDLCANCKIRPATLDWVGEGGTLAYVHGMSVRWCERCAVEAQLAYAEKLASEIPVLRARLQVLAS